MNLWQKMYGAKRAAIDRKLLAAMEREIANEEKLRAKAGWTRYEGSERDTVVGPAPCIDDEERARIARAFGRPG